MVLRLGALVATAVTSVMRVGAVDFSGNTDSLDSAKAKHCTQSDLDLEGNSYGSSAFGRFLKHGNKFSESKSGWTLRPGAFLVTLGASTSSCFHRHNYFAWSLTRLVTCSHHEPRRRRVTRQAGTVADVDLRRGRIVANRFPRRAAVDLPCSLRRSRWT